MVLQYMLAGGRADPDETIAIFQGALNDLRQLTGLQVIIDAMLVIDEGLVSFDALPADKGRRARECCFVGAKAIPSVAFGRPDQPGARAARKIFGRRHLSVAYFDS